MVEQRNTTPDNLDDLIALYALGALDADDRAQVERRLANDAQARALLDEFNATVATLHADVAEVEPTPRPKQRVLARIDASSASERLARPKSVWEKLLAALRAASPFVAVASLLIAIGLGAWGVSQQQQLAKTQQELAVLQALQSPDVRVASLPPSENAPQTAKISFIAVPGNTTGLLTVNGLPPLAANQTYEFWLLKDGNPVPAGLFNVDANGTGRLVVTANEPMSAYQQAGITVEPAGGSAGPTLSALVTLGPIN